MTGQRLRPLESGVGSRVHRVHLLNELGLVGLAPTDEERTGDRDADARAGIAHEIEEAGGVRK